MSNSLSNVKQLCEEYFNSSHNEEGMIRILGKMLSLLRISEKFQKEVFINLSDKGLNKLLSSMKDSNLEIRKLSFKVIIELLSNNEVLQNIFCEKFGFNPIGNIICLNWLPKYIKENIKIDEKLINEIRQSNGHTGKHLRYWMWPENDKYNDEVLPDPQKYLLGFFYSNKNSLFTPNLDEKKEEKFDTRLLLNKLENENLEEEKLKYVPAGSGSESSAKINESLKEKYTITEPVVPTLTNNLINSDKDITKETNSSIIKKNAGGKQNFALDVNSILDKIKITHTTTSANNADKTAGTKKLKDDYKKIIKEKNYSRSIDTNIPKLKTNYGNGNPLNTGIGISNFQINSGVGNNINLTGINSSNHHNNDIFANRIRINKVVKK